MAVAVASLIFGIFCLPIFGAAVAAVKYIVKE